MLTGDGVGDGKMRTMFAVQNLFLLKFFVACSRELTALNIFFAR